MIIPIIFMALLWLGFSIWVVYDDRSIRRRYGDDAVDRWNEKNKLW